MTDIAKQHADALQRVAAQLSAERPFGWGNPLVCTLTDAVQFLLREEMPIDTGDAVLFRQEEASEGEHG